MTLEEVQQTNRAILHAALMELCRSWDHEKWCIGYSEGQTCCLEKPDVVEVVLALVERQELSVICYGLHAGEGPTVMRHLHPMVHPTVPLTGGRP